ncbi:MAG: hypothetical protein QXW98_04510 [Candidatus Caldarchaeum sp.]
MSIPFMASGFREARREFRGRIVRAEWGSADPSNPRYNKWVFPEEAPEEIRQRQKERQATAIRVEIMPVDQDWNNLFEWYTISDIRLSKWYYFIDSLAKTKAPTNTAGNTDEERLDNFTKSLVGMEFKWSDYENLPTAGRAVIKRLLLPVEYYGKFDVGQPETVKV